jgi:hypothetical protein
MALKTYEIVVEGVVSATHIVEAENPAEASEIARRDFSKDTGANYHGLAVVDIFKQPSELELDLMRRKGL